MCFYQQNHGDEQTLEMLLESSPRGVNDKLFQNNTRSHELVDVLMLRRLILSRLRIERSHLSIV